MKKWKIAAAAACVCALLTAAYAATAGGAADPLVTLSYLNGTFARQVQEMVDQTVDERKAELEQALAGAGQGASPGGLFSAVTLGQGQTLMGDVGCEILLRTGSAAWGAWDGGGFIDATDGSQPADGGALAANHLYLVTAGTRSVTATSGTAALLVRGPYSIR